MLNCRKNRSSYVSHASIALIYAALGDKDQTFTWLEKADKARDGMLNPDPYAKSLLALALSKSGGRVEALKLRDELADESARRYLPGYHLAIANLAIGDRDAAFAYLEKEIADRGPQCPAYAFDPVLDELRSDPRFAVLVKKIESSKTD